MGSDQVRRTEISPGTPWRPAAWRLIAFTGSAVQLHAQFLQLVLRLFGGQFTVFQLLTELGQFLRPLEDDLFPLLHRLLRGELLDKPTVAELLEQEAARTTPPEPESPQASEEGGEPTTDGDILPSPA